MAKLNAKGKDMYREIIEILCNNCKCTRFRVIKPAFPLKSTDIYYTCSDCLHKKNKNSPTKAIFYAKNKKLLDSQEKNRA
jgi:hypothetical protein